MIGTLLVSIIAGVLTPQLHPHIASALASLIKDENLPDSSGQKVASFGVALLIAAVLCLLLGWDARPVVLILGGLVGYFQKEIRAAVMSRTD